MFSFNKIIGNKLLIKSLKASIKNNRVNHAYIFDAPIGMGKKLIANTFAKTLQCESVSSNYDSCGKCKSCKIYETNNHPDVIFVEPTKTKSISVEDIREQINNKISVKPYSNKYKIFIIDKAETMSIAAQNAILKTIEEPPEYGIFILLTTNSANFLETILSRCVLIKLKPLSFGEICSFLDENKEADNANKKLISMYSQGNIGKAIELFSTNEFVNLRNETLEIVTSLKKLNLAALLKKYSFFDENKDNTKEILDIMLIYYRDVLTYKKTNSCNNFLFADMQELIIKENSSIVLLFNKIDAINETKIKIAQNANYQLTIEMLLFALNK